MKKNLFLISILIVVLIASGCTMTIDQNETHLPFSVVNIDTFDEQMIEFIELIKDLRGFTVIKETSDEVYVYVGSGEKPTGGYGIEVDKVISTGNFVSAIIEEASPGPNDMVTEAYTYPYVVFKMDRSFLDNVYVFDEDNIALAYLDLDPQDEDISIRGQVTSLAESEGIIELLVESEGKGSFPYDKASVRIDKNTLVMADGKRYSAYELKERDIISIIFHGLVAESYPVQAYGSVVVKENIPVELPFYSIKDEQPNVTHIGNERGFSIIDESDELIIMISSGKKPTGGYSIKVDSVTFDGTTIFINVTELSPAEDAVVTQVITYPYDLIRFDKVGYIGIEVINQDSEMLLKVK